MDSKILNLKINTNEINATKNYEELPKKEIQKKKISSSINKEKLKNCISSPNNKNYKSNSSLSINIKKNETNKNHGNTKSSKNNDKKNINCNDSKDDEYVMSLFEINKRERYNLRTFTSPRFRKNNSNDKTNLNSRLKSNNSPKKEKNKETNITKNKSITTKSQQQNKNSVTTAISSTVDVNDSTNLPSFNDENEKDKTINNENSNESTTNTNVFPDTELIISSNYTLPSPKSVLRTTETKYLNENIDSNNSIRHLSQTTNESSSTIDNIDSSQDSILSSSNLFNDINFLNSNNLHLSSLNSPSNQKNNLFIKGKMDTIMPSDIIQRKRGRKKKSQINDSNINLSNKNKDIKLLLDENNEMINSISTESNYTISEDLEQKAKDEKRKRNTAASARFRARKKKEEQAIQNHCKNLENENKKLKYNLFLFDIKIKWLEDLLLKNGKNTKEFDIESPNDNILKRKYLNSRDESPPKNNNLMHSLITNTNVDQQNETNDNSFKDRTLRNQANTIDNDSSSIAITSTATTSNNTNNITINDSNTTTTDIKNLNSDISITNINSITGNSSDTFSFIPTINSFNLNDNEYQEMNINVKTVSPKKTNNVINDKLNSIFSNNSNNNTNSKRNNDKEILQQPQQQQQLQMQYQQMIQYQQQQQQHLFQYQQFNLSQPSSSYLPSPNSFCMPFAQSNVSTSMLPNTASLPMQMSPTFLPFIPNLNQDTIKKNEKISSNKENKSNKGKEKDDDEKLNGSDDANEENQEQKPHIQQQNNKCNEVQSLSQDNSSDSDLQNLITRNDTLSLVGLETPKKENTTIQIDSSPSKSISLTKNDNDNIFEKAINDFLY
ncbi:hypothetical protein H8356DRAFT_1375499 [Neocallimastix lanati (nom. inval.)]|uniref:BZIP domain-containing protein n=1 Tax=Neocallimastix californiae TaxID=1754190 RepID=A0A1Y2FAI5_9FUNG|nr:hypothetical protein H8356DRAFT_1375499 [Neocallimastix sp. JGI-2020a]ORY80637.1 hypothetical protein LY90DRAFT_500420 [Neocallimastix californiae]|eukprot:ORY80637.1 hypothetical protein LY90DRAFT_500420 [Neocallimastix californiae]